MHPLLTNPNAPAHGSCPAGSPPRHGRRRAASLLLGLPMALALIAPSLGLAQDRYPSRPVRIVVPFAAGGIADIYARVLGKAMEWARHDAPWVKRAGFALMAGLAVHDKAAPDRAFLMLLPLIEQAACDDRNFVRKAVNWALRNIGKRNPALNTAALACARKILAAANARAGGPRGGDASSRSARWVATDAIRELAADRRPNRTTSA